MAEYGNWVAGRLVYAPAFVGVVLIALSVWTPFLAIPALISFFIASYFAYARYLFASGGGDVQMMVWTTLLNHIQWDGKGKALDIGCGSGALSILLAKTHPEATVTGVDNWGKAWGYSKGLCDSNAAVEGVSTRVAFQRGSASSLPFPDEAFDIVVSNLTFHEVKDVCDKKLLIKEALRVLKRGGGFAFQDLFLLRRDFGSIEALLESIKSWEAKSVDFEVTGQSPQIPRALKLSFMVGAMGLISGKK